jgi:hypothetical protein
VAEFMETMRERKMTPEDLTTADTVSVYEEAAIRATRAGFESVLDMPFMQGLETVMDFMTGSGSAGDRIVDTLRRVGVETVLGGPGRTIRDIADPTVRQRGERGEDVSVVEKTKESLKAAIPGLSKQLRPRLSTFGTELERPSAIDPTRVTEPPRDEVPIIRELKKLGIRTAAPSIIKSKTEKGKTYKFTQGEDVAFRRVRGQLEKKKLAAKIAQSGYQRLPSDKKKKILQKIRRDINADLTKRALLRKKRGLTFSESDLRGRR